MLKFFVRVGIIDFCEIDLLLRIGDTCHFVRLDGRMHSIARLTKIHFFRIWGVRKPRNTGDPYWSIRNLSCPPLGCEHNYDGAIRWLTFFKLCRGEAISSLSSTSFVETFAP